MIVNRATAFKGKPERFKLWPSRGDREAFEHAMDPAGAWTSEHSIVAAHEFFKTEARAWLEGNLGDDETAPGTQQERVKALSETLQFRLFVVAINLAGHDDDQVIFETLNDRGTPLLKADLIKNWVFQQGEALGAAVEAWPETYWGDFDDDWCRKEITQGRHMRSRIDIFLQYWLTMRIRDEVLTDEVFRGFIEHAKPRMTTTKQSEQLLGELRRDADTFRSFAQLSVDSPEGRFYNRVVEALELASTTPLLLWMLSENHTVPPVQVARALAALESWVIRRTLLRYTMKDVNKMMVAMLAALDEVEVDKAGDVVAAYLAAQTSDARAWPGDQEMATSLPKIRLYGNVRQGRIRVVLEAIEAQLRSGKNEAVSIPPKLEIEHVMPQGWKHYWNTQPPLSDVEAAERDRIVNTLGNLTLLTRKLNGALSHRPWTDQEAEPIAGTGPDAGLGKRSLINKYSLLVLSKELVDGHPTVWTERDIEERSKCLVDVLCRVWPGPDHEIQGSS